MACPSNAALSEPPSHCLQSKTSTRRLTLQRRSAARTAAFRSSVSRSGPPAPWKITTTPS
eukprot:scaffold12489_cov145-Isochrysis_galbana.AAC.4